MRDTRMPDSRLYTGSSWTANELLSSAMPPTMGMPTLRLASDRLGEVSGLDRTASFRSMNNPKIRRGNEGDEAATANAGAFGEKLYPQLRQWLPR
jgi:hypothetical protein